MGDADALMNQPTVPWLWSRSSWSTTSRSPSPSTRVRLLPSPPTNPSLTLLDPSNDTEFQVIVPSSRIQALSYSHVCLDLPSLVPDATAGTNATLQLRYVAEYIDSDHGHHRRHLPVNETFYSCADVTLVTAEAFAFDIPCFNVTGSYDEEDTEEEPGHSHDEDEDHDAEEGHDDEDNGGSGLGKGDIAGIVVGSVVGAAVLATVAWYLWRRDRREKQVAQHIMAESPEK
jgi:hypothetical protein